ncbi:MAG: TM0106 family RecB-like putative nuclease, partial [Acidobacteriota bacterium]
MLSATAVANFLACPHLTTLDRAAKEGELKRPFFDDPEVDLLRILGIEHEENYLRHLREDSQLDVVLIPKGTHSAELTIKAMKQGAAALYQAVLIDGPRLGYADFLIRVDKPSDLGFWSYEVVETKLARSTRVTALIQLCFYTDILSKMQGVEPDLMHVVLGRTAESEKFPFKRYAAYFRRVLRDYNNASETRAATYPEPTEHCGVCNWAIHCDAQWRRDDHLSLVAGITRHQRKALAEIDVATVASLGALSALPRLERVGAKSLENIRDQARIQVEGRDQGRTLYELLGTVELNKGLASLPSPSAGDMFLDFEGEPFAFDQGLEYLIGVVTTSDELNGAPVYEAVWAMDPGEEKRAFEDFIAKVMERRQREPGMHVYHFAPYEVNAIKRLAGRHSTCTDEVDELLRGGVFIDLYRVVRQSLRASVESYSIKRLEPLYDYIREVPLRRANYALRNLGLVLAAREGRRLDDELRKVIAGYNRDDCLSTLRLRDWLEERRIEVAAKTCVEVPRPQPEEDKPGENLSEYLEKVRAVDAALRNGFPDDEATWSVEENARALMGSLLEWHRREDKSAWWEYFRLRDLSTDELMEDQTALGGLVYQGIVGQEKRSLIHRYSFPAQDYKIAVDKDVRDPVTEKSPGTIVAIDEENLTVDIKRAERSAVPHPAGLIPCDVVGTRVHRESLLRLGEWIAANKIDGPGHFRAARDVLLRQAPRVGEIDLRVMTGDGVTLDAARQIALSLEESVLPVQGPPGSGKTYLGARLAVELIANKKRVGITANSHKVISNLLKEICVAAHEAGVEVAIVQKADDEGGCDAPVVTLADDNDHVLEALK